MAFSIIEVLKLGQTEYIDKLRSDADLRSAVKWIRLSAYKEDIAKACQKDFDNHPYFWLDIIYDLDCYFFLALEMREKYRLPFTIENYQNILYNSKYGESYIYENFNSIIEFDENFINVLLRYVVERSNNKDFWLDFLIKNENMHVRALVMIQIIKEHPNCLKLYGNDLTIYFTNNIGNVGSQISLFFEKMDSKDVSLIAYNLFLKGYAELFKQAKGFLFQNYDKNYLGYYLFDGSWYLFKEKAKEEVFSDANRYFLTNERIQFTMYRNYADKLKKEILEDFKRRLKILNQVDKGCLDRIQKAYFYNLGKKLELYIEKYLDLSRDNTVQKIGEGTTCYALRLGDFVLKLVDCKWSYENIICPNLFLIIKNLEEDYVRSEEGIVRFGLEIQPYLRRSAVDIDSKYFTCFRETLEQLGYFLNDRLFREQWGDNVRILDSYKDADTEDVESLPFWFKEVPLVLIDRDRVYPTNRIEETSYGRKLLHIKQLSSGGAY